MENSKMYIGVKMVEAIPMTSGKAYNEGLLKEKDCPNNPEETLQEGYAVDYGTYISWCPKSVFDKSYYPIQEKDKISPCDVQGFIDKEEVTSIGGKNTVVALTCKTGFQTLGTSGVVKKENYDVEIGKQYAKPKAEDGIWFGLGFVLQWAMNGLKGNK